MEITDLIKNEIKNNAFTFLSSENCYFTPKIPFNKINNIQLINLNKCNFVIWVYKNNYSKESITVITDLFIYIGRNEYNYIYIYWKDLKKVSYNQEKISFIFNLSNAEIPLEINNLEICPEIDLSKFEANPLKINDFCSLFKKIISYNQKDKLEEKKIVNYLNKDIINYNENGEDKPNTNENILDSLKKDLIKSILGIFKFIFYFVPKTLLKFFRNILPNFIKLLNVIILLLILIQIIIFPIVLNFYKINENIIKNFIKTLDFSLLLNVNIYILNDLLNSKLFIFWTPLALLGALWGIKNINSNNNNIIKEIKKIIQRKNR